MSVGEIEWIETRDRQDPEYEPRNICVEGFPGQWNRCRSKPLFESRWGPEPLTPQVSAKADEQWARQQRRDTG